MGASTHPTVLGSRNVEQRNVKNQNGIRRDHTFNTDITVSKMGTGPETSSTTNAHTLNTVFKRSNHVALPEIETE